MMNTFNNCKLITVTKVNKSIDHIVSCLSGYDQTQCQLVAR